MPFLFLRFWISLGFIPRNPLYFSLPGIAIQSTGASLLGILKEIFAYGIYELYAKHNRVYNVFLHEPFFVESLNRAVLEENQSIKANLETFLGHFLRSVNHLAWPDPQAYM